MREIFKAIADCNNHDLPKDIKVYEKVKCGLENGLRVFWYGEEDKEYSDTYGGPDADIKRDTPWSGIIVGLPDRDYANNIEIDNCFIAMDRYPIEKDNCCVSWIALNRLLDNPKLIEIYSEKELSQ